MNTNRAPARPSLRRRIVLATAVVTSLGMAALVIALGLVLARVVGESIDGALQNRAEAVIATLNRSDGSFTMPETSDALEDFVWIYDQDGRSVAGTVPEPLAGALAELRTASEPTTVEQSGLRLRAVPIVFDDETEQSGVVVVGEALEPYRATEATALLLSAALGVLVVVGVSILAAWVVGRALRPVTVMADRAAAWSEEDLSRRFNLGEPRDEITQLGAVLDNLLERVSRTIVAEQRLTSELAHELRTPLTVIRAEAELAASDPDVAAPERARFERIIESADSLTAAIDTLLAVARGRVSADERAGVDGDLRSRDRDREQPRARDIG